LSSLVRKGLTDVTKPATLEKHPDFSLVLGGPLYHLWRRAHLSGDTLQLARRRVVVTVLLVWAPLLALTLAEGHFWTGSVKLPFLHDVEMHLRLLLALPLLIMAELLVHERMRPMVAQFLQRDIIAETEREKFNAAIASAIRLRNSITVEVLLMASVYVVGVAFFWRTHVALDVASWYGVEVNGRLHPTLAGWWMGCVSLPLFQFLLLRWYFRMYIWARFLWQVSRIDLNVLPTHPDRCGGLGFLSLVGQAFGPVLVAQGVLLAGMISNKIFFAGAKLPAFQVELIAVVALMIFAILGPLLVFTPKLEAARREGLRVYGALAQRYAREFDQKWVRGGAPADEPLLGSADIQSLADLGNSFQVVKDMKLAPFTLRTVLQLAITTLLPVAPLLLTVIPLDQLLDRLLKLVF